MEAMKSLQFLRNNQARNRLLATTEHIRSLRIVIVCLALVIAGLW